MEIPRITGLFDYLPRQYMWFIATDSLNMMNIKKCVKISLNLSQHSENLKS